MLKALHQHCLSIRLEVRKYGCLTHEPLLFVCLAGFFLLKLRHVLLADITDGLKLDELTRAHQRVIPPYQVVDLARLHERCMTINLLVLPTEDVICLLNIDDQGLLEAQILLKNIEVDEGI